MLDYAPPLRELAGIGDPPLYMLHSLIPLRSNVRNDSLQCLSCTGHCRRYTDQVQMQRPDRHDGEVHRDTLDGEEANLALNSSPK